MLKSIERMTRQLIPVVALPALPATPASHASPVGARDDDERRPHRQGRPPQRQGRSHGKSDGQGQRSGRSSGPSSKPGQRPQNHRPRSAGGGGSGSLGEVGFLRSASPPRGQDR